MCYSCSASTYEPISSEFWTGQNGEESKFFTRPFGGCSDLFWEVSNPCKCLSHYYYSYPMIMSEKSQFLLISWIHCYQMNSFIGPKFIQEIRKETLVPIVEILYVWSIGWLFFKEIKYNTRKLVKQQFQYIREWCSDYRLISYFSSSGSNYLHVGKSYLNHQNRFWYYQWI